MWIVPFNVDSGAFYFKAINFRSRNIPGYGCLKEIFEWYDENSEIFTGGEIFISITVRDFETGSILAVLDSINCGKILGLNPRQEIVNDYINDNVVRAIKEVESFNYQFEYKENTWPFFGIGWPIYGEPNGYGLMQLDDPAGTERQLWNWKANIDAGKSLFYEIKSRTDAFLNKHPQQVTQEMRLKCAYQKYNFFGKKDNIEHFYYIWDKEKSMWKIDNFIPFIKKKINGEYVKIKYGDYVYLKYLELEQRN